MQSFLNYNSIEYYNIELKYCWTYLLIAVPLTWGGITFDAMLSEVVGSFGVYQRRAV